MNFELKKGKNNPVFRGLTSELVLKVSLKFSKGYFHAWTYASKS